MSSLEALEQLVKPLIKTASKLVIDEPILPPKESQLKSHIGGEPYFETGEKWPKSKSGTYMNFIMQIFNEPGIELPENIKLVQFYYDAEESPWETDDDGWKVKVYEKLDTSKVKKIPLPEDLDKGVYCDIKFEKVQSLPDWESLELYSPETANLSTELNEKEPWASYGQVVEKLIGDHEHQSQLGGYPSWVQDDSTPENDDGDNMPLLFQLISEEEAELAWGDDGLVYVFYDKESGKIEFNLQCY